jgi:hypothetical protein
VVRSAITRTVLRPSGLRDALWPEPAAHGPQPAA